MPLNVQTAFIRRALCLALAVGAAAAFVGCASPPPKPSVLTVNITASSQINPDARKRPSPVVVRTYELKSSAQFTSADFVSLYDKDQALLGGDIVAREEFVLRPGEAKATNKPLAVDAKFLGVMVAYRELERALWRGLVALVPGKNNTVTINLDDVSVQTAVVAP